jgi:hypothetical protein
MYMSGLVVNGAVKDGWAGVWWAEGTFRVLRCGLILCAIARAYRIVIMRF